MSQQRRLIAAQDMSSASEDDSDFTVQGAQDRLKRKKFRRVCVCVSISAFSVLILIVAGIVVAILAVGTNQNKNHVPTQTARPSPTAIQSSSTPKARPSSTAIQPPHTPTAQPASPTAIQPLRTPTPPSPTPVSIPANSKVLNYMDKWYDPCENFYEYSCGYWHNHYPDKPEWGTFEDLELDNLNKLSGYLSQYPSSSDPNAIKKAKYIYSACTDTDYIDYNYEDQLKSFMVNKGRGWENGDFFPAQSWSINDLYKDHYYGSSAFFSFGIVPDDLDSSKQVIRVMYV